MIATVTIMAGLGVVAFGLLDMLTLRQQSILFAVGLFGWMMLRYRLPGPARVAMQMAATPPTPTIVTPRMQPRPPAPPPVAPAYRAPVRPVAGSPPSEQRQINALLYQRRILFQLVSMTETPDYYCYILDKLPGAQFAPLRRYLPDLASEIYQMRGGQGEPVHVSLSEQPPMLRVTAPERTVLAWSERARGLKANTAQVGAYWTLNMGLPLTIDFADQKQWSLGVFSSSGGGKSMLLRAAVLSLLENCAPGDTEFYFIDLDSNQYDAYRILPHVRCVAGEEAEAVALLSFLAELVEDDRDMSNTVRRYLVIDEFQMLSAQSEFSEDIMEHMSVLAQRGRKHGVNLLLSTQDPSGANYPTVLQRNTKVILAGLTEDGSYLKRWFGVDGADKLRGDGDFIFKSAGKQLNFKGLYVSDEDVRRALGELVARWGKDDSGVEFVEAAAAPNQRPNRPNETPNHDLTELLTLPAQPLGRKEQRVRADAEKILPYLDEAYDYDAGALRPGWGVLLIEKLYGGPKPNAGNYSTRLDDALDYALGRT